MKHFIGKIVQKIVLKTLLLSSLVIVLLASGCSGGLPGLAAPTETPTQTPTVTPSPTLTPTPTMTPTITPSPTPTRIQIMVKDEAVTLQKISVDNAGNLERLLRLETDKDVKELMFLPDGETLVVFKKYGVIQLWDALENQFITEYTIGNGNGIKDPKYNDGKLLFVTCADTDCVEARGMQIDSLQLETGEVETVVSFGDPVFGYTPAGKAILGSIFSTKITYTNNGKTIYVQAVDPQWAWKYQVIQTFTFELWEFGDNTRSFVDDYDQYTVVSSQPLPVANFNPDGSEYVINGVFSHDGSMQAQVSEKTSFMLGEQTLEGPSGKITDYAFSVDDTLLLAAGDKRQAVIWSVPDGTLLKTLDDHALGTISIAISPNNTLVASCAEGDTSISIWGVR